MKFNEDPSSGSRVVPCGDTDGLADRTKVIVAFRNFANAPNTRQCNYKLTDYQILKEDPAIYGTMSYTGSLRM